MQGAFHRKEWPQDLGSSAVKTYLKSKERHDNGHPAQCHCYVCPSLFCNHIHGAQEQDRPYNIIENYQAQKGHENPQWDTHNLRESEKNVFSPLSAQASEGIVKLLLYLVLKTLQVWMPTALHAGNAVRTHSVLTVGSATSP